VRPGGHGGRKCPPPPKDPRSKAPSGGSERGERDRWTISRVGRGRPGFRKAIDQAKPARRDHGGTVPSPAGRGQPKRGRGSGAGGHLGRQLRADRRSRRRVGKCFVRARRGLRGVGGKAPTKQAGKKKRDRRATWGWPTTVAPAKVGETRSGGTRQCDVRPVGGTCGPAARSVCRERGVGFPVVESSAARGVGGSYVARVGLPRVGIPQGPHTAGLTKRLPASPARIPRAGRESKFKAPMYVRRVEVVVIVTPTPRKTRRRRGPVVGRRPSVYTDRLRARGERVPRASGALDTVRVFSAWEGGRGFIRRPGEGTGGPRRGWGPARRGRPKGRPCRPEPRRSDIRESGPLHRSEVSGPGFQQPPVVSLLRR